MREQDKDERKMGIATRRDNTIPGIKYRKYFLSLKDFLEAVERGEAEYPLLLDDDYYCPKCGEPWDAYSVWNALGGKESDISKEEAKALLDGKGCPCCLSRKE